MRLCNYSQYPWTTQNTQHTIVLWEKKQDIVCESIMGKTGYVSESVAGKTGCVSESVAGKTGCVSESVAGKTGKVIQATRSYRPKLYWTIQQESSQMTQFLSIWFEINACTACSDFNPSGHDSYPLAYIGSTFEEGCFTQPCCTSMRLLHTSNEITQEQSGLFPLREIWKIGASSLQIINILIRQAQWWRAWITSFGKCFPWRNL